MGASSSPLPPASRTCERSDSFRLKASGFFRQRLQSLREKRLDAHGRHALRQRGANYIGGTGRSSELLARQALKFLRAAGFAAPRVAAFEGDLFVEQANKLPRAAAGVGELRERGVTRAKRFQLPQRREARPRGRGVDGAAFIKRGGGMHEGIEGGV